MQILRVKLLLIGVGLSRVPSFGMKSEEALVLMRFDGVDCLEFCFVMFWSF